MFSLAVSYRSHNFVGILLQVLHERLILRNRLKRF